MTRRVAILLTLVVALCLGLSGGAAASRLHPQPAIHKSSSPAPVIKSVSPLRAKVGDKLTVVGKNFRSKSKTKVFFMRKGGGITSAKPSSATKTKLVVKIPASVSQLLNGSGSTRFQIRVLTSQYGDPTKMSKSPLIAPKPADGGGGGDTGYGAGDCDHDGIKNRDESDDDNDLIPDTVELGTTKTDECNADTDGDGISDGYEWQSAKDINNTLAFNTSGPPLPYPGKRPWPNPLDKSDAAIDHDGDGLTMADEYKLFKIYGHNRLPLNYSDGLQASQNVAPPHADPTKPGYDPALQYMTIEADGRWTDDELDADGDGLGNWDESHGRMLASWWKAVYEKERPYPNSGGGEMAFTETDMTDADTDGDGIKDGADDQDHDGLSNAFEVDRPSDWFDTYISTGPVNAHAGTNPWARVNPYNPCKPVYSKTCHLHWPFKYYGEDEDWVGLYPIAINPPPAAPWLYTGEG